MTATNRKALATLVSPGRKPHVTRLRWTPGPDGIAHAHVSGRTACRVPSIGERYAWPIVSRCPECVRILEVR
jgi:hypothetical protein